MYFSKEDILKAEHDALAKAAPDLRDTRCDYTNGFLEGVLAVITELLGEKEEAG